MNPSAPTPTNTSIGYSTSPDTKKSGKLQPTSNDNNEDSDILADYDKPFSNYIEVGQKAIKTVVDQWKLERQQTESRRKIRFIKVNVDEEKRKRNLEEDELFIPIRLVDTNITREQAKYAQFITQSPRNAILEAIEDPAQDTSIVEKDFTTKGRYNGWEIQFLKTVDGMQMHGTDGIELLLDTTKPGHITREHVGHDCLLYPTDTKDFQASPFCIRLQEFSTPDLVLFTKKKGWNAAQVKKVIEANQNRNRDVQKNDDKAFKLNQVEKVFFQNQNDGFIYIAWSCAEFCDDWLRPPKLCFIGNVMLDQQTRQVVKLYETAYPIEPFIYLVSENETMMDIKGRVELDEAKGEAATSLVSSFCTAHRRAAQPYFSLKEGIPGDSTVLEEAETNIKLKAGRLFKVPIQQFQLTPPSEGILEAVNTLIGQSQMESGDVNYAVQSNKSTRKTAAEINLAQQENALLSSVQVSLLSIAMRNVFSLEFKVYSSRVICGLIKTTPPVMQMIQSYTFNVKAAGDTDVIERQTKTQLMIQMWSIMQQTGASSIYLKNLVRLLFPDEAAQYIAAFQADDMDKQVIQKLSQTIMMIVIDPQTHQLRAQFQPFAPQLQQLQQMVAQALAPKVGDDTSANGGAPPPQSVSPQQSNILPAGNNRMLNAPQVNRSRIEQQNAMATQR